MTERNTVETMRDEAGRRGVAPLRERLPRTVMATLVALAVLTAFQVVAPLDTWQEFTTEVAPRSALIFAVAHLFVWPYVSAWGQRRRERSPGY